MQLLLEVYWWNIHNCVVQRVGEEIKLPFLIEWKGDTSISSWLYSESSLPSFLICEDLWKIFSSNVNVKLMITVISVSISVGDLFKNQRTPLLMCLRWVLHHLSVCACVMIKEEHWRKLIFFFWVVVGGGGVCVCVIRRILLSNFNSLVHKLPFFSHWELEKTE